MDLLPVSELESRREESKSHISKELTPINDQLQIGTFTENTKKVAEQLNAFNAARIKKKPSFNASRSPERKNSHANRNTATSAYKKKKSSLGSTRQQQQLYAPRSSRGSNHLSPSDMPLQPMRSRTIGRHKLKDGPTAAPLAEA